MKKIIFFLVFMVFIFCLKDSYALKLGITPAELNFSGKVNQVICKNFSISTDFATSISGETKWDVINPYSRELEDYYLSSENLGITVNFPEKIEFDKKRKYGKICINAKKSGEYFGVLLYKSDQGYLGVGSWLILNISEGFKEPISDSNNSTFNYKNNALISSKKQPAINYFLILSSYFLLFVLIGLLALGFKRKRLD